MEKHVHVASLIHLHFSCRCSFSAFYIQILCIWKLLATQWLQKQLPTTIVKYQNKGGQNQLFVLNSDIQSFVFPFADKSSAHLYKTNYSIVIPCCCKAKWKDTIVVITFYEQCNLCLVLKWFPIVLSNHSDMKEGSVLLDARRDVTTFKFMWLHHSVDPLFC